MPQVMHTDVVGSGRLAVPCHQRWLTLCRMERLGPRHRRTASGPDPTRLRGARATWSAQVATSSSGKYTVRSLPYFGGANRYSAPVALQPVEQRAAVVAGSPTSPTCTPARFTQPKASERATPPGTARRVSSALASKRPTSSGVGILHGRFPLHAVAGVLGPALGSLAINSLRHRTAQH